MEIKYYPPVFRQDSFHCPHCNVYSHIKWEDTCLDFYHVEYFQSHFVIIVKNIQYG